MAAWEFECNSILQYDETKTVNFLAMEEGAYRIIKNDIGIFTSEMYPITEEQALEIEQSLKKDPASFNVYFYRERAKAPSYFSDETFEFFKTATVEAKEGDKINVPGFQEPLSFYTQTDKTIMFKADDKDLYLGLAQQRSNPYRVSKNITYVV